jgi:predicted dehydrogenase
MFDPSLSGGGILNWESCHWFDLMRFLTGAEVAQVAAIEANVGGEPIVVEDAATVSLRFTNGMIGSLHTGFFLAEGHVGASIGLRGSAGLVQWSDTQQSRCTIRTTHPSWQAAPERTVDMPRAVVPGYGAAGAALIKAFARAIRGEGSSGYTIDDAIKSLQIIEAAHEAARTGRTVSLAQR